MCDCGCNTCETKSTLMLNESLAPRDILSEGLKHHMDANKPLTDHLYRAGSDSYFNLWAEARSLYSRNILEITNKDDLAVLTETDLGHYGMFEGKKVPLDFPIEITEEEINTEYYIIQSLKTGSPKYIANIEGEKPLWVPDSRIKQAYKFTTLEDAKNYLSKFSPKITTSWHIYKRPYDLNPKDVGLGRDFKTLEEAKKNTKKLNKPMRDSSGGKAYKVYVKDPKTKKIKTVRFGSGGLRAKINDKKARNAFAKRHKCSTKKDKTKAGYWSCRLPRYAKLLGLKSNFGGFW